MASSQQVRRENVTDERKIEVEKDRVPKMATHFESLADKVQDAADVVHPAGTGAVHVKSTVTTVPDQKKSHLDEHGSQALMQQAQRDQKQQSSDIASQGTRQQHESQPVTQHAQREKQQSSDVSTQGIRQQGFQEKPGGVEFEVHGQQHRDSDKNRGTQMQKQSKGVGGNRAGGTEETKGPSLEEISQYRQTAQQNSIDAVRAAEERYEKAKEMGASTLHNVKESATHGLDATGTYATEKGTQAKDTITQGLQKGTQYVAEKAEAAKDTALEKGYQACNVTKDTLSSAGQAAAQSAQQAKDYTMQKAGETKDYVAQKAGDTKDYTMQKTGEAKDYVAPKAGEIQEQSKGVASYVGEKAAQVKDVTVETGKGAVGYAGKVAGAVKDTAVVAGWGAAHFTAEKAADATKAMAGVASSVAGYAGEKTVAAKDLVADAGMKTVGYAEDKLAAAKDYVVSAEESAAEYAARKKAEAERDLEAKKSHDNKGESEGSFIGGEKQESKTMEGRGKESGSIDVSYEEEESGRGGGGGGGKQSKKPVEGAAVVLQAIGETIVEIGKTTTDLVAGRGQTQTGDEPVMTTEKESITINKA